VSEQKQGRRRPGTLGADPGDSEGTVNTHLERDAVAGEPQAFDAPRSYLFVSARKPLAAAAAVRSWNDGPPDLSVTSRSPEADDNAAFACAVLVVCDELPDRWPVPFVLDGDGILERAVLLASKVTLT
jgi:hypothetical protein